MTELLLKLKINLIFRYAYTGFLLIVGLILYNKSEFLPLLKDLNELIIVIFGLTSGAFLYTIYRYVIGEIFLYPLVYIIHFLIEKLTKEKLNMISYLKENGINWIKCRIAYNFIRGHHFKDKLAEIINFEHSEIHFVNLTALTTILVYVLGRFSPYTGVVDNRVFLYGGLLILACGVFLDIRQHRKEIRILKYEEENSVIIGLKKYLNQK